jgi:hypothetical protein
MAVLEMIAHQGEEPLFELALSFPKDGDRLKELVQKNLYDFFEKNLRLPEG